MEQQKLFKIRDKRKKGWFFIDNEYLNGYARIFGAIGTAIYVSLCRHANNETQECFPSQNTIAEELNIGVRTVKKYIKKFKDYNIIGINRERHPVTKKWLINTYYLLDKSEWKEPGASDALGKPGASECKSQGHQMHCKETKYRKETITEVAKLKILPEVNKIFNIFYEINPTIEFENKTQRKACIYLIEKFGLEKVEKASKYAVSIFSQKYAPTITNPLQLKKKFSELISYWQKNKPVNNTPI